MALSKRQFEESKEDLKTIENAVSDSKFQSGQQVQNTTDANIQAGEGASFTLKKNKTPGSVLKQEVAAKTIKDASYGGVNAGDGLNAAGRAVGGDGGGILGAANMTPEGGKSRSETRYGKKLDRNSTKLNFIPNDQVLEEYEESKPLAEAAADDQGFNGTYRNEFGRSQKKVGNVPAELMFSRSLDYIEKDQLYFVEGQYVKQDGVTYHDMPTKTLKYSEDEGAFVAKDNSYDVPKGNYLNRSLNVAFGNDGVIRFVTFDTRDVTPVVDANVANKASSAAIRARNKAELVREEMDSKAGDEKADIWSPIPRAIAEPVQTVAYIHDIESMTGSEIATAYKKATVSHSFQINRAHKDGQFLIEPMFDAFKGMHSGFNSADAAKGNMSELKEMACYDEYNKANAFIMIDGYDSLTKYKTKADVLIQPRSLRMHLQTADNNMDPFRVNKDYVQIYDNQEVFSTIDREFDPLLPICMSDKAATVTPLSYADLYTFVRPITLKYDADHAGTANKSIVILPKQFNSKAAGNYLHLKFDKSGTQTAPTINTSTGVITINDNIEKDIHIYVNDSSSDATTSELELVVDLSGYADLDITIKTTTKYYYTQVESLEKVFPYKSGPYKYQFSDLRNFYQTTVSFPLLEGLVNYLEDAGRGVVGKYIKPTDENSARAVYDDCYLSGWKIPCIHSTRYFSLWSYLICAATPYILKSRINSMRDILYYEKNIEYPFKDLMPIKDMTTRGYTNFNYTDYDHELECKVMHPATAIKWVFPEFWTKIGSQAITVESKGATKTSTTTNVVYVQAPWYINENTFSKNASGLIVELDDMSAMTMPSIRSGSRLAALDSLYGMSEKDIRLSLDAIASLKSIIEDADKTYRDAAYNGSYKYSVVTDGIPYFASIASGVTIIDALKLPRELGYVMDAPYGLLTANVGDTALTDPASQPIVHGTSHRITYWLAPDAVKFTPGQGQQILNTSGVNINRAANFKQTWFEVYANGKQAPFDHGMVMSVNGLTEDDGDEVAGSSQFTPYTALSTGAASTATGLATVHSLMKALWTRIQKLPFVISPFDALSADSTRTQLTDIFELAYYFGLCGFRASDYRESVYNREKEVINQGLLFTVDPWMNASPLFREGAVSSGVALRTGFGV